MIQEYPNQNIAIPLHCSTKNHTPEVYAFDGDKKPLYYRTYNYDLFEYYEFNREVRPSKVRELARVIKDYSVCPIQVKQGASGKLFILDGQHRLQAAKRTGNQIYYRIIEMDPLHIADLQVSSKWNIIDWVNFYCHQQLEDYVTLRHLFEKHEISMTALVTMLTTKRVADGGYYHQVPNDKIKKGTFKITNLNFATKILKQLRDYPKEIRKNVHFIKALIKVNTAGDLLTKTNDRLFSEYHHDVAKKKIEKYPEKIGKRGDTLNYIKMIEDLMNAGNKNSQFRYRFL